jgi:hypothetical protein
VVEAVVHMVEEVLEDIEIHLAQNLQVVVEVQRQV